MILVRFSYLFYVVPDTLSSIHTLHTDMKTIILLSVDLIMIRLCETNYETILGEDKYFVLFRISNGY